MKTLRMRLFAICLLAILLPMIIANIFIPRYYQNVITKETQTLSSTTMKVLARNIETYLVELQYYTTSLFLSDDYLFALEMRNKENYHELDYYDRFKTEDNIRSMLSGLLFSARSDTVSAILIANDGVVYQSTRSKGFSVIQQADNNFQEQSWYNEAIQKQGRYIFAGSEEEDAVINNTSRRSYFSLARQVQNPVTGKHLGVLLVSFDNRHLQEILQPVEFNVDSIIGVSDQTGHILFASSSISENMRQQLTENTETINADNDIYVPAVESISGSPWQVFVLLSQTQLNSKTNMLYLFSAVYAIVVSLVAVILFTVLSRSITKPFQAILHTIKQVESGNLDARSLLNGRDEVSVIGQKMDEMLDDIDKHIEKDYKAEITRKNLEYLALQSQVNPHFLFNTLNSFVALNQENQRDVLDKAIRSLTSIMRYSLNQKEPNVTLVQEMQFIQQYCQLQRLRFGKRFQYDIYYEDTLANCLIPRMLLQPIVENAVIHGIEGISDIGVVEVRATQESDGMKILIRDNGVGFEPDKVDNENAVGLKNVQERLRYAYANSKFEIDSKPGYGTDIIIIIPDFAKSL